MQQQFIDKKLKFFVIDGYKVARETGMGGRINTIMQTCFFAISGVLPREEAIAAIKQAIRENLRQARRSDRAEEFAAVDHTLAHLHEVAVPSQVTSVFDILPPVPHERAGVRARCSRRRSSRATAIRCPSARCPPDGTFPTGTAKWEKRNIAQEIPVWDEELCIQCGKCVLVCPHAVIRAKVYDSIVAGKRACRRSNRRSRAGANSRACATRCKSRRRTAPAAACASRSARRRARAKSKHKAINMEITAAAARSGEQRTGIFSSTLPEFDRDRLSHAQVKDVQLLEPLFEFSGACAGCGETPYIKLLTQFFGDRLLIANATGCSSIYGGNLPTTPYT